MNNIITISEYASHQKVLLFTYKIFEKDDDLFIEVYYSDNLNRLIIVSDLDFDIVSSGNYLLMQLSSLFFNNKENTEINNYTSGHLSYLYQLITSLSDTTLTKLYKACKINYSKLLCADIIKFITFYIENKKPKLAKRANLEMKLEK